MKGVQCYELFGGIALKIHTFLWKASIFFSRDLVKVRSSELYIKIDVTYTLRSLILR